MECIKCEICGKEFKYEKLSSCKARLTLHLKKEHNIDTEEYIVKYILNGEQPKCLCGCGNYVSWNKHKGCWNKYYADSHVGKVNSEYAAIIKENLKKSRKVVRNLELYYKSKYDENIAKNSINDFLTKEYTLSDLENKYKIDRRTLKKMWFELNLIDGESYRSITEFLQYNLPSKKIMERNLINCSCYTWLFSLIKENPQKYTTSSAICEYNKNHDEKIVSNPFTIYKQLKTIYGDEIDLYLMKGTHSKEEYTFYEILKFFFPKLNIKVGFRISNNRYAPTYDICINNKYIIEYDSKGTYHSTENIKDMDKFKEEEAIKNGFEFKRLNYDDIHDLNIIINIKEWLSL